MDTDVQAVYFHIKEIKKNDNGLYEALQYYLKQASDRCQEKTFGLVDNSVQLNDWKNYPFDGFVDDVNTDSITIIVVHKPFYKEHLSNLKETILDGTLFNYTLGHVHLTWSKVKDICALWDVCKHFKNTNDGVTGLGSILMESILDGINQNITSRTLLWLGVDFRNNFFIPACNLYAKFGFGDPYISKDGPFENLSSFPLGLLCLSRENIYIDEDDIDRTRTMEEIDYTVGQYIKLKSIQFKLNTNNYKDYASEQVMSITESIISDYEKLYPNRQDVCNLTITIPKKTAKRLYKLINYSTYNTVLNTVTQKEVSGSLNIDRDVNIKDIWHLGVDSVKECVGMEDRVFPTPTRYNFHTHTHDTYEREGVNISFPSGLDWPGFLHLVLNGKTSLHFVITREGIYLLEISEHWCSRMVQLQFALNNAPNENWQEDMKPVFQLDRKLKPGQSVIEAANEYVQTINTLPFNNILAPIFKCTFFHWTGLFDETNNTIPTTLPSTYGQCILSDDSYNAYIKFEREPTNAMTDD